MVTGEDVQALTAAQSPPHAMRRRILAVLAAHPEGLHAQAIAQALDYGGDLGPTLRAMRRDGRVRRVKAGVYAVEEEKRYG